MKIAERVANEMHKQGVIKDSSDIEIYRYGIDNGLNILINLIISLCIAGAIDQEITLLVFLASYVPLRAYSGGWHFSSKKVCCIASNIVIGGVLIMNNILSEYSIATGIAMIWSVLYLWNSKQKDSSKRELSDMEKYVFGKKKRQFLFMISVGVIFLIMFSMSRYATAIIASTTLTAVLVFFQQSYDKATKCSEIT